MMQIALLVVAIVEDIVSGDLDESARKLFAVLFSDCSEKDSGGVRPIAIGDVFYRLACHYVSIWFNHLRRLFSSLFSLLSLVAAAREPSIFCRHH